ncbi:MAG: TetR/AcrR family transcriptional regulator [Oscillospiraceae bacterium]|nr:TetR/AcrR family transcriptional regulator [Oscillospiraceae bacterium]
MPVRRVKTTKLDIVKCAATLFFEQGYSATSPRQICDILDLSTGNISYYFPTKDQLLAVFVEMLCDYQWEMMEEEAEDGISSVMAICLELATMIALCDENEIAKDFYISTYTSPVCLEIIRRSDAERAKKIFAEQLPDWDDEQFAEAETLVSGIEYSSLMTTGDSASVEKRISGAIHAVLGIYGVPKDVREAKVQKVLTKDYRKLASQMLPKFKEFIDKANDAEFDRLVQAKREQLARSKR